MVKKAKSNNALIKKRNLTSMLRKKGIKRISPEAVFLLEKNIEENLSKFIELLKEEITIKGRTTLMKEDIISVLQKSEEKEDFWEI